MENLTDLLSNNTDTLLLVIFILILVGILGPILVFNHFYGRLGLFRDGFFLRVGKMYLLKDILENENGKIYIFKKVWIKGTASVRYSRDYYLQIDDPIRFKQLEQLKIGNNFILKMDKHNNFYPEIFNVKEVTIYNPKKLQAR